MNQYPETPPTATLEKAILSALSLLLLLILLLGVSVIDLSPTSAFQDDDSYPGPTATPRTIQEGESLLTPGYPAPIQRSTPDGQATPFNPFQSSTPATPDYAATTHHRPDGTATPPPSALVLAEEPGRKPLDATSGTLLLWLSCFFSGLIFLGITYALALLLARKHAHQ